MRGVTIMMYGQLLVTHEPNEKDFKLVQFVKHRGEQYREDLAKYGPVNKD